MAELDPRTPPGFEQRPTDRGHAWYERTQRELDKLQDASAAMPDSQLVGAVIKFQVADGYAHYLCTKESPLTLQHLPIGDCYKVPAAMIRGLREAEVLELARFERGMQRAFAQRKPRLSVIPRD